MIDSSLTLALQSLLHRMPSMTSPLNEPICAVRAVPFILSRVQDLLDFLGFYLQKLSESDPIQRSDPFLPMSQITPDLSRSSFKLCILLDVDVSFPSFP